MNLAAGTDGPRSVPVPGAREHRKAWVEAALAVAGLMAIYAGVLCNWLSFAAESELYSHLPLIPAIAVCLIWRQRIRLAIVPVVRSRRASILPFLLGLGLASGLWLAKTLGWMPARQDHLFVLISSLVLCIWGSAMLFLGRSLVWQMSFPLGMLLLMAPLPIGLENHIEAFFQRMSADAAWFLFRLFGSPVTRRGLVFDLPELPIEVARECSGIRSSLVLFITSLLAAHLFLRTVTHRVALVLLTVPLGILRNGFRIFVIGEMCIDGGPRMLDSWVHKKGGPLFFSVSLLVFACIIGLLRADERRRGMASG